MNEFCAIMGLCNLKHAGEAQKSRKYVYERYTERISKIEGIKVFEGDSQATKNYSYYPILVTEKYKLTRDELYDKLKKENIYSRKYFYPVTSDQACFKNKYRDIEITNARHLSEQVLTLPFYEGLSNENVDRILNLL